MSRRIDIFYAYPSTPPARGEVINLAIAALQASEVTKTAQIRFKPWPDMSVTGVRLLTTITDAISRADIFACDVSEPNSNVAFELGFAIAKFKRLWISLDSTLADPATHYKRLYTGMLGAGYSGYQNDGDLANAFLAERPWKSLDQHVLGAAYRRHLPRPELPTLLYVRPQLDTPSVTAVSEYLARSPFADALLIDNPRENPAATLDWYVDKLQSADAIAIHFLADDQRDAFIHNIKASFVAGLAHGFGRDLFMMAHAPYECPMDYASLLSTHNTASEASHLLSAWLEGLQLPPRRARRPDISSKRGIRSLELRSLALGEPVAENENLSLDDYFVETSAYFEALAAQTTVFVGRRGTGKTATFIALQNALSADKRNHVCAIKPAGYEVDGLIRLLAEEWQSAERGHLIETLWKYLIYSELAISVADEIRGRPPHQPTSRDEETFLQYVEAHSAVLLSPFSQRLSRAVGSLLGSGGGSSIDVQRSRISEQLHATHITALRRHLGLVLARREKVVILIDNLDEPWVPGRDPAVLSSLLLGLLRESQNILMDLRHHDDRRKSVNISITIFIRSDIFSYVQPLANEQDKWPLRRVSWNDPELLLRVIDERLRIAAPSVVSVQDLWKQFFPEEVVGLPVRDFIIKNSMPRPRDVIFFVKESVSVAVNRGHPAVTAEDMLVGREKYSRYVLASVLAEDDPGKGLLEEVLYEFAGVPKRLAKSEVVARIKRAGVETDDADFYLSLLCDINFLAIQTSDGFRFAEDENDRRVLLRVAGQLAASRGWAEESFEVNPAFYQALQIDA